MTTKFQAQGKATALDGGRIQILASKDCKEWCEALQSIVCKASWPLLLRLPIQSIPCPPPSSSATAYNGTTLAALPPKRRVQLLEEFARDLYHTALYPGACAAEEPPGQLRINGFKRGINHASFDFMSGTLRVEVKSAQLTHFGENWRFRWPWIKRNEFDRLVLVATTPDQMLFWEWDGYASFSTTGSRTDCLGGQIQVSGPRRCTWQESVQHIKTSFPCRLLLCATITQVPGRVQ